MKFVPKVQTINQYNMDLYRLPMETNELLQVCTLEKGISERKLWKEQKIIK
jgi:hypothetical protein